MPAVTPDDADRVGRPRDARARLRRRATPPRVENSIEPSGEQIVVAPRQRRQRLGEQMVAIDRASELRLERRRPIAQLRRERRRQDVEAVADDDGGVRAGAGRLGEDPAELAPRHLKIVRPLEIDAKAASPARSPSASATPAASVSSVVARAGSTRDVEPASAPPTRRGRSPAERTRCGRAVRGPPSARRRRRRDPHRGWGLGARGWKLGPADRFAASSFVDPIVSKNTSVDARRPSRGRARSIAAARSSGTSLG